MGLGWINMLFRKYAMRAGVYENFPVLYPKSPSSPKIDVKLNSYEGSSLLRTGKLRTFYTQQFAASRLWFSSKGGST
jgi:hypothetical protein